MENFNIHDIEAKINRGQTVLTKFLEENESAELESVLKKTARVHFFGGFKDAERKRALITDFDTEDVSSGAFEITACRLDYPKKFTDLSHRQVLGTIMSLGLNRNTIGDIIVSPTDEGNDIYVIATNDIARYLKDNLSEINHARISLEEVDLASLDQLLVKEPETEDIIVTSLRLDVLVARLLNVSRSEANEQIAMQNVKINHKICDNTSQICKINDIISIRKLGRVVLYGIKGTTKKERIVLTIGIWR